MLARSAKQTPSSTGTRCPEIPAGRRLLGFELQDGFFGPAVSGNLRNCRDAGVVDRKRKAFGTAAFAVSAEHRCLGSTRIVTHRRTACRPCRVVVRLWRDWLVLLPTESAQVDVTLGESPHITWMRGLADDQLDWGCGLQIQKQDQGSAASRAIDDALPEALAGLNAFAVDCDPCCQCRCPSARRRSTGYASASPASPQGQR